MKHTATKLLWALCGMAVMLALVTSIASVPALALSNGIYLATATPHYRHPTTGVIEDSGGEENAVLGQSMTESATYNKALIEVDSQGNTYVTVRLQLMDNIKEPQFQVDGKTVTATLMQENYGSLSAENTADYRMKVNSENSVIRCNMFVVAMGREVIFYITVSNLQSGSGDFISSVKVEKPAFSTPETSKPPQTGDNNNGGGGGIGGSTQSPPETVKPQESDKPQETVKPEETKKPQEPNKTGASSQTSKSSAIVSESPETGKSKSSTPETTVTESAISEDIETTISNTEKESAPDESDVLGLQEFDKSGDKVSDEKESSLGETKKQSSSVAPWIIGGALLVVIAGVCIWYFAFYRKKKIGRQR